ncbi:MAG TPA: toll/interleukin-1 receptor domain-containing protein, partial [Roseiflexaceae bacterium]|nr:toll/interleukin-1 receptor domain-containing protein [Roseiflexaceae bacterium]
MATPEQIVQQQRLLETHRSTLSARLNQQAMLGVAHTPPEVVHDIREARASIERIKDTLRSWGVALEDHPDDDSPDNARRKRIFISYKRNSTPDEPLAKLLVEALRAKHDVFIDQAIPIGADWVKRIDTELRRADFLITLLSERSIHSEMLKGEIETAHRVASLQAGRPAILPLRVGYREPFQYPLSAYLNKLNWAYWGDPKDTPQLLAELERAIAGGDLSIGEPLKARLVQPSPPAPLPRPLPDAPLELPEGTMAPESA